MFRVYTAADTELVGSGGEGGERKNVWDDTVSTYIGTILYLNTFLEYFVQIFLAEIGKGFFLNNQIVCKIINYSPKINTFITTIGSEERIVEGVICSNCALRG